MNKYPVLDGIVGLLSDEVATLSTKIKMLEEENAMLKDVPALREPSESDLRRVFGDDRFSWLDRPSVVVGPGSVRTRVAKPEGAKEKTMNLIEHLRSEAQGFITDWLAPDHHAPGTDYRVVELDRGARIIEAQRHEIDRLEAELVEQRKTTNYWWEQAVSYREALRELSE